MQFINYLSFQQAVGANGFDNIDQPTISPNTKYWDFSTREREGDRATERSMFNEYFYGLSFMARRLLRLQLPLGHQMNIYTYGWAGLVLL